MVEPLPAPFDGVEVVVGAVVIRLPKRTTPRSTTAKRITDVAHRFAHGT